MSATDLSIEKVNLIRWITQLQDADVIAKLKQIQSEEDVAYEVPVWHESIVAERQETDKADYQSEEDFKKAMKFDE